MSIAKRPMYYCKSSMTWHSYSAAFVIFYWLPIIQCLRTDTILMQRVLLLPESLLSGFPALPEWGRELERLTMSSNVIAGFDWLTLRELGTPLALFYRLKVPKAYLLVNEKISLPFASRVVIICGLHDVIQKNFHSGFRTYKPSTPFRKYMTASIWT